MLSGRSSSLTTGPACLETDNAARRQPRSAAVRRRHHAVRRSAEADGPCHPQEAALRVADALNAIDRLERSSEAVPTTDRPTVQRGQRNRLKAYRIEGRPGREALCEYRADDPDRPFRCPKATYDALVWVMAAMPKLAKFSNIAKRIKKLSGKCRRSTNSGSRCVSGPRLRITWLNVCVLRPSNHTTLVRARGRAPVRANTVDERSGCRLRRRTPSGRCAMHSIPAR